MSNETFPGECRLDRLNLFIPRPFVYETNDSAPSPSLSVEEQYIHGDLSLLTN